MSVRLNYNVDHSWNYRKTKLSLIVDEFIESGAEVAEIVWADGDYKNAASCRGAFDVHLKHRRIGNVGTATKNGKVFLVRKENK